MPPEKKFPNRDIESRLESNGYRRIAGVDEVGRGAWAGPVMAAAVILPRRLPDRVLNELDDSKKLSPSQRSRISLQLAACDAKVGIGSCSPRRIDALGIVPATRLAMMRAVAALNPSPDYLIVDALQLPDCRVPQTSVIKGDARCSSVAAASIFAKVQRDRLMQNELHEKYPQYDFKSNKGYGTPVHRLSLITHGPSQEHRHSFRPIMQHLTP